MSEGCYPQRLVSVLSAKLFAFRDRGVRGARTRLTPLVLTLLVPLVIALGAAGSCLAQHATERAGQNNPEVVIEATRQAADEEITRQVQRTLTEDPWVFSKHVTITTRDGVVRIDGIVQDTGELFRILDLARKIPGARRVVDAMEMLHNDPDGG